MNGRLTSGAAVVLYETLDSTSLEAKRRAEAGGRGPLWIAAIEQSAGYGRRGSAWEQAAGDVAASFLFDPQAPREALGQLSFVAALAGADALRRFAPKAPVSLKWPNDILVDGGKIAGLLLELIERPAGPLVALGLGVNIVSKPGTADYPAARLIDWLGGAPAPAPKDFVKVFDEAFDAWRGRWRKEGFEPIRTEWLSLAAKKGEKIRVRLPAGTLEGVFADLDSTGALVLDCDGETRLISAGAVMSFSPSGRRRPEGPDEGEGK